MMPEATTTDQHECIRVLRSALERDPLRPDLHLGLGKALSECGDGDAAIFCFQTALALNPEDAEIHFQLGLALKVKGDLEAGMHHLRSSLNLNPAQPEAWYKLGNCLLESSEHESAASCYQTALSLRPDYPEALINLGNALAATGDLQAAVEAYQQSFSSGIQFPQAHNNLGNCLLKLGKTAEAIASYRDALTLRPDFAEAHNNLAGAHRKRGHLEEAAACHRLALQLRPDSDEFRFAQAITQLLAGDYGAGLELYESRFRRQIKPAKPDASPLTPPLTGEILAYKQHILVVSEQGIGDTLQFVRYLKVLENQGLNISFCTHSILHPLIEASGISNSLLSPAEASAFREGVWLPLLSLPRLLKIRPDRPLITEPYLSTTEAAATRWQQTLSADLQHAHRSEPRHLVGVHWQGNPEAEQAELKGRSLPLETFSALAAESCCTFLSLQKGFGSEQLDGCSFRDRFIGCQQQVNETWDFVQTAAIIACCDLIITSDSAVAHLAGGMGKTTWLLLQQVPDWRWGLEGEHTFWYPSTRLFRQREAGNWAEVMQRVATALGKHPFTRR
jgi:tetratricopeptide (TPR) repeat protein